MASLLGTILPSQARIPNKFVFGSFARVSSNQYSQNFSCFCESAKETYDMFDLLPGWARLVLLGLESQISLFELARNKNTRKYKI